MNRRYFSMLAPLAGGELVAATHITDTGDEAVMLIGEGWPEVNPATMPEQSRAVLERLPVGYHWLRVTIPDG